MLVIVIAGNPLNCHGSMCSIKMNLNIDPVFICDGNRNYCVYSDRTGR